MKMFLAFFLKLVFVDLCLSQILDGPKTNTLDQFFKSLNESELLMGQVEVYQDGQIVYTNVLGYSNIDLGVKAERNSKFRIGSISKTITATMVLKAVEEGKIGLDQTIEVFFPTIKNAKKITISHLLTHHSGIHNFTGDRSYLEWNTFPKTEAEMVSIISSGGSDFEPGEKAEYSNSNYVLLSYILEKVYNKHYAKILRKKIIKPLGLRNTQFGDSKLSEAEKTYSYKYEVQWNPIAPTDESIPMGAGGIVMSAQDLSIFIDGLFKGKIISKELQGKMLQQIDGYGMGVFKTEISGKVAYTHDGVIDGFNSVYYYFPDEGLTYLLLSNGKNYNLADIHNIILKMIFDQPYEIPLINPYKVDAHDLEQYLGVYTSQESPLVITISQKEDTLLAQPEGQKIYTMDAMEKDFFKHHESGVTLEFDPSTKTMVMRQGSNTLHFTNH
ncbi:MAG: serine hydrolase domain-containing protein [Bacteroidota bacterium]